MTFFYPYNGPGLPPMLGSGPIRNRYALRDSEHSKWAEEHGGETAILDRAARENPYLRKFLGRDEDS